MYFGMARCWAWNCEPLNLWLSRANEQNGILCSWNGLARAAGPGFAVATATLQLCKSRYIAT